MTPEELVARIEKLVIRLEEAVKPRRAIPGTAKEEVNWDTGKST